MSIKTVTHINFQGQAAQALQFYQSVFGGQITVITYQDARNVRDPLDASRVMWGQVASEEGFQVMAYDVPTGAPLNRGDNAFFVSVRGETANEIAGYWAKLVDGATVIQSLEAAAWSPLYGMLKDKFGVVWVLDVQTNFS